MAADSLFMNQSEAVHHIYQKILSELESMGPYEVEVKKTSSHLVNKSAFGGVHPKKNWLDFNFVMANQVEHEKITKVEQVPRTGFIITSDFCL